MLVTKIAKHAVKSGFNVYVCVTYALQSVYVVQRGFGQLMSVVHNIYRTQDQALLLVANWTKIVLHM